MKLFLTLALLLGLTSLAQAALRLPQIFSDRMVLQREQPAPVWGWAGAGETVTVTFAGQTQRATADATGKWRVALPRLTASTTGRDLVITTAGAAPETRTIKDVLVGEVWFTAGQSNMMMGIGSATGGAAFYTASQPLVKDQIRVVHGMGPYLHSDTPRDDIKAAWTAPSTGYSAVSYWFAVKLYQHFKGEVPIGMITFLDIAPAEAWIDRETLAADPRLKPTLTDALQLATKSYNGVIAAVAPYGLRGVLYYQAEYNGFGERGVQFRTMMPALINTWRRAWERPELPFLFVQLPGFIAQEAPPSAIDMDAATLAKYQGLKERKTWTEVRESQLLTWQTMPHTGMAVTIDVGEPYDIHPPKKEPVAERLFRLARHYAYGEKLVYSGPVPAKTEGRNGAMVVTFDHIGGGLSAQGGVLKGFEVAGSDLVFQPATAEITGNQVVVRAPQVPAPVHLRYAWDGNPTATLYNQEGLPATPFRWSDWSKAPMPDRGAFAYPNASFEEVTKDGAPALWRLGPNTQLTTGTAADGQRSIEMTEPKKSGLFITGLTQGTGCYWNAPPLAASPLRPGCLASYRVAIAALPGSGLQTLYTNLCLDASASGYQAWGGTRDISTASETFVTRTIVHRMTDTISESIFSYPSSAGARFIYWGGAKPGGLRVDALSPVQILRPTLELASDGPIDLGAVPVKTAKASAPFTISNGQKETVRQQLTDADAGTDVATILYGAATFSPDGRSALQKIIAKTDHVGALLIGKDADKFIFVSDHCGDTKQQLKLVGPDGQGGLLGGPTPERETFTVQFIGAEQTGTYTATLRLVTQAGNRGVLSQANESEPPANLYYLDLPVTVRVGP
jgi:sialate O-acetylesterase